MNETIDFIGLGGVGLAIATNLLRSGFGVRVSIRTPEKARPLQEQRGTLARSPAAAGAPRTYGAGVAPSGPLRRVSGGRLALAPGC